MLSDVSATSGMQAVHPVNYSENVDDGLVQRIRSVEELVQEASTKVPDSCFRNRDIYLLESIVYIARHRFCHAYNVYTMQENWVAVLCGKFIWKDLCAKVDAEDILNGSSSNAACSQVSIVIMEACRQLDIPTRKIAMTGHYTLEAMIQGKWYFIDADLKPDFSVINGRKSLAEIVSNRDYYKMYARTGLDSSELEKKFNNIRYGEINEEPAPRAFCFLKVTKYISRYGWLLPLALFCFYVYRLRRIKSLSGPEPKI